MAPCIIMSSENNALELIHLSSPSGINSIERSTNVVVSHIVKKEDRQNVSERTVQQPQC